MFSGPNNALISLQIRHFTVLGNPPLVTPQTGAGGTSDYTVRWGDTLTGIAAAYRLTLCQIEVLNPQIGDPNRIYVGEIIHLY